MKCNRIQFFFVCVLTMTERTQSMQSLKLGKLERAASMQSLNNANQRRGRSRSRSRNRARTPSRNVRGNSVNRQVQRSPSVNRQGLKRNFGRQKRFNSNSFGQQMGNVGGRRGKRNALGGRNQRLDNYGK